MSYINAAVEAVQDERKYYTDLIQYAVWWIVNGRRTKGQETIPIQDWSPAEFMIYLRQQSKELDTREVINSDERKKIIARMDEMHRKEMEQKNKKE